MRTTLRGISTPSQPTAYLQPSLDPGVHTFLFDFGGVVRLPTAVTLSQKLLPVLRDLR